MERSGNQLVMTLARTGTVVLLLGALAICWGYNLSHPALWFVRAAVFQVLFLFLALHQCLHIREAWLRTILAISVVVVLALYSGARIVSFYYQGESFNEEFLFHFNLQTLQFGIVSFPGLATLILGYLLLAAGLGFFSVYKAESMALSNRTLLIVPGLVLTLAMDPDITHMAEYSMQDANASYDIDLASIDWEATGLNPEALYKSTDEITAGKNVVMIYLESMEKMYTDESVFPGLTPFLNSLADEALSFENLRQTQGANFTVAGIVSSQCGTPLLIPPGPGGNDILRNGFLQEGFCLGDILHTAGYHQVFMGGATTRFAGKGVFLSSHGYDEVDGVEELRPLMEDSNYLSSWGLYDDTLLDLAANRFDELAADTSRPFNFTVLTVDTHPPEGTPSASCKPYPEIDNIMFDAIYCTDQLLEKFIDHLKQSPAWDDTIVFIMSDHLHMRNVGMDYYPPDYDRKLFVDILNAGRTGKITREGTHMDLAPTLLSLMGVQHRQAFLAGNNLLVGDSANLIAESAIPERMAAIRYINTNMLSRIETGLCEADPLYSYQDGITLRVAGREVNLTERGRPMSLEKIGDTHALLTLVSPEGKVGLSFPVEMNYLDYVLYQFREYSFFMLIPADPIRKFYPDLPDFGGLGVLFGNLQEGFQLMASGLSFKDSFNVQGDCKDLLARSRRLEPETLYAKLGDICENTVPDNTTWQESQGSILLDGVAYRDQRFRAHFRRNDKGWYAVDKLDELDPIAPQGSCDAYYRSQEILIPGIQTEDGPASLTLKKIPGITLTFELGEVTPLPD